MSLCDENTAMILSGDVVTWALSTSWLVTFTVIRSQALILINILDYQSRTQPCLHVNKDCICLSLLVGIKRVTSMCWSPQSHKAAQWNAPRPPHGHQEFLSSESFFDNFRNPVGGQLWVREQCQCNKINQIRCHERKNKRFQLVLRKTLIVFPVLSWLLWKFKLIRNAQPEDLMKHRP